MFNCVYYQQQKKECMGFVSNSMKFYKKTQSGGEMGHVQRQMKENKNVLDPELSKNNFGEILGDINGEEPKDLNTYFKKRLNDANDQRTSLKMGVHKKSHNAFCDMAVIFDREIFGDLIKNGRQDELKASMGDFMSDMKKEYGFEPIGFEFHLDEGYKDKETGEIKHNYHAHAIFLNHDFKTGKAPLRDFKKKQCSESQDLTHKHFKKYGFERGISKSLTNKNGLDKEDYLSELQAQKEELENTVKRVLIDSKIDLKNTNDELKKMTDLYSDASDFNTLKDNFKEIENKLKDNKTFKKIVGYVEKKAPKTFNFLKKKYEEIKDIFETDDNWDEGPEQEIKQENKIEQTSSFEIDKGNVNKNESKNFKIEKEENKSIVELKKELEEEKKKTEKIKLEQAKKEKENKKRKQRRSHSRSNKN